MLQDPETSRVRTRFHGLWKGTVEDNNDSEKRGRARIRVSQLYTNIPTQDLPFAEPGGMLYGGLAGVGVIFPPEVGSAYWVMFEQGDPDLPVYFGPIYGKSEDASEIPAEAKENYPNVKEIKTASGHFIKFDDTPGQEHVQIETSSGHKIKLDDAQKKITVDSAGGHNMTMDDVRQNITMTTTLGRQLFADDITQSAGMQTNVCRAELSDITQSLIITTPNITITGDGIAGTLDFSTTADINLRPQGAAVINLGGTALSERAILGDAFKAIYDAHVHTDPQGGSTGPPTVLMPTSTLATKAKVI